MSKNPKDPLQNDASVPFLQCFYLLRSQIVFAEIMPLIILWKNDGLFWDNVSYYLLKEHIVFADNASSYFLKIWWATIKGIDLSKKRDCIKLWSVATQPTKQKTFSLHVRQTQNAAAGMNSLFPFLFSLCVRWSQNMNFFNDSSYSVQLSKMAEKLCLQ